jgi:hypothetical protein
MDHLRISDLIGPARRVHAARRTRPAGTAVDVPHC